jgi:hypothetical protein
MPRKAYIADLKQLSSSTANDIDGVSDIRSGDDDGEFRFKVAGEGSQYEISALIPGRQYIHKLPQYLKSAVLWMSTFNVHQSERSAVIRFSAGESCILRGHSIAHVFSHNIIWQ